MLKIKKEKTMFNLKNVSKMKKLKVMMMTLMMCLISILFVSCSKHGKIEIDNNWKVGYGYKTTLPVEDLVKTDGIDVVTFSFPSQFKDSLNLSDDVLIKMCKTSLRYADWGAKHKLTYKLTNDNVMFMFFRENIVASLKGSAENSFGVPGNISTFVYFDIKGDQLRDNDGLPIIIPLK